VRLSNIRAGSRRFPCSLTDREWGRKIKMDIFIQIMESGQLAERVDFVGPHQEAAD
jgi:hypothetical protein